MKQNKTSNKANGNSFERTLCEMLRERGYWVHNMAQNQAGQPADVIAVKNHSAYLIDAKVCSGVGFQLSRIESNQESAMTLWHKCNNGEGWFAFLIEGNVYFLPMYTLTRYRDDNLRTVVTNREIIEKGWSFDDWVKQHDC